MLVCAVIVAAPVKALFILVTLWIPLSTLAPAGYARFMGSGTDQVIAGLVCAASLMVIIRTRTRVTSFRHLPFVPLVYIGVLFATTWAHGSTAGAAFFTVRPTAWILCILAIERVSRTHRDRAMVLRAATWAGWLLVLTVGILVLQNRFGLSYYTSSGGGGFEEETRKLFPHVAGLMGVVLLAVSLSTFVLGHRKLTAVVLSAALVLCVMVSFVRSSILGMGLVLIAYLFVALRQRSLRLRMGGVALVCAVTIVLAIYQPLLLDRFRDLRVFTGTGGLEGAAGSGRVAVWRMLADNVGGSAGEVLFGRGTEYTQMLNSQNLGVSIWSHNDFFEVYFVGGLVLWGAFVALVCWLLVSVIRVAKDRSLPPSVRSVGLLLVAAVLGWVVISFTNGAMFYVSSIALGVVVGLARGICGDQLTLRSSEHRVANRALGPIH